MDVDAFNRLTPDAFKAGVGTGGTIMGVGKCLEAINHSIKIHSLDAAESPILSTEHKIDPTNSACPGFKYI